MTDRIYCSEQSSHEPMMGTADQVDVWVLLEYRPAWKARAIEESSLGPAARAWLVRILRALAERGLKARPQLIRQPEIDGSEIRLLIGLPDALLCLSGRGYGFLESVSLPDVVAEPGAHPRLEQPQYFVCTNGQRDVCCARYGLPVYAGLRERLGDSVWQTTHLGGHRFAPNVLTLPQGVVYGRVPVDALDDFVATVQAGRLAFQWMRGRAWYAPPVQAAEVLMGESDLRFIAMAGDDAAAAVSFVGRDGERTVRVRRAQEPMRVLKSCADAEARPVNPYLAD